MERLEASGARRLQFLVLTVPPHLRSRYSADPRHWSETVRSMVGWLKGEQGARWAYCRSHPCGDDGQEFHPHANVIWVQGPNSPRGRLDPDAFRAAWARALGYIGPVDVHLGYVSLEDPIGRTRLRHHVRYIERHFPGWTWSGAWARWYGEYPQAPAERPAAERGVCPSCGKRYEYREPVGEEWIAAGVLEDRLLSGRPLSRAIRNGCRGSPPALVPLLVVEPPPRPVQGALFA